MTIDLSRRTAVGALASLALGAKTARAQDTGPLEWVVPFAAGGASDFTSRLVAEPMARHLGRPFVIVNKAGASTQIAAEYVAAAKGTVLMTADQSTLATNPALFAKLRYDADKDLVPIGILARTPIVLAVNLEVPAKTLAEFVAWANAQDGANYGSAGLATGPHLAGEMLRAQAGLKLNHVPYKGSALAAQEVVGRQISAAMLDLATAQQHMAAGKLKALAISTAARLPRFPQLPTFIEQGVKGYEVYAWQALAVSAATPREQRARLASALAAAMESDSVKERYQAIGLFSMPASPEEAAAFVRSERQRWTAVIKSNNIRLD